MKREAFLLAGVLSSLLGLGSVSIAQAVSLPECIMDSQDANNIIQSAPCGVYGIVNSRQVNATGSTLDVTVEYMVHLPIGAPKAIVMLFAGGNGDTGIQGNDSTGEVTSAGNNFLVRSAQLFAEQGYLAVTIDRPSDTVGFNNAEFDQYRVSPSHAQDIIAVLSEVNSFYGTAALDLFLAGTSRGAISVVAQNMLGIGSMLSAPVTSQSGQNLWIGTDSPEPRLMPGFVTVPVEVLTHKRDGCFVSTPENSKKLHKDFTGAGVKSDFERVNGGFEVNPDPCQATTFHGFLGIENKAVNKVTHRMDHILKRHDKRHRRNTKPAAENTTVTIRPALAVDIDLAGLVSDLDGDALGFSLPHGMSSRDATLAIAGSVVTYTPPPGATNIADGFVYQVFDGKGGKSNGLIIVLVN
jgi:hypothetical protein